MLLQQINFSAGGKSLKGGKTPDSIHQGLCSFRRHDSFSYTPPLSVRKGARNENSQVGQDEDGVGGHPPLRLQLDLGGFDQPNPVLVEDLVT